MQYKKGYIYDRILAAATDEFEQNGYQNAAIKSIAENSNVTVGNIYRYFPSKKILFDAVVEDAYKKLPDMIEEIYEKENIKFNVKDLAKNIAASVMNIYNVYSKQILILFYKSQGTRYSNFVNEITEFVTKMLEKRLFPSPDDNDRIIAEIISHGFVNSLFTILKTNDRQKFQSLTERLLLLYFYNIEERL
ncbi:MAG: TetR/AcrR family transcriptional regulator [Clostridia bacterium]|nr:TetR/AcrR family transcriptional regulator [Clostridia bacterium]